VENYTDVEIFDFSLDQIVGYPKPISKFNKTFEYSAPNKKGKAKNNAQTGKFK
jgi:hypothetical protein